ncbi:FHIPEP family type III secretion protein [Vibrio cholerae]|uniref:FHIPEP family type III secretion protein n=1 Tax=Vibrio cholerae TaxID=666 RepID=UPI00398BBCFE
MLIDMKYPKLNFKLSIFSLIITLLLPTIILISLPGGMIDTLIVFSFISSFLLLVIMLENDQPLKVTFLPTIVLLLTTFRLLLSIATTRNIIANDDVGQVIETVGNTVMGGNLISGLLIFTIITIVQFLVVTKGGERVAEVGARFSLDAMPGRQMTIDGDLKAGLISPHQAQRLRSELSTENKLFGSLDGAMKFIKGDAIAGILISFVNLFGGIYVGINQFNLTFSDSIAKFSVLTIGDGLVSQIPSLILSLACGVYLTRIKGADDSSTSFSSQLFSQIKSFWKSLITIGFLLLVIGILNYNLIYVFFPFALSCLLFGFYLRKNYIGTNVLLNTLDQDGNGVFKPLMIVLKNHYDECLIHEQIKNIQESLWLHDKNIGLPKIRHTVNLDCDMEIYISDILVYRYDNNFIPEGGLVEILVDHCFVKNSKREQNLNEIIRYFLRSQLITNYNIQHTQNIIDELGSESDVLKSEIDSAIGLTRVHEVIKQMIQYPEFYLDRINFFESLLYWARIDGEPKNWFIRIRPKARYEITKRLVNNSSYINFLIIDTITTENIQRYVMGEWDDTDALLSLQSNLRKSIINYVRSLKSMPVVVVNDNELHYVKQFFQQVMSTLPICGSNDVVDSEFISSSYNNIF